MAKKKRNKKYHGRDAAQGPTIKKFEVDGSFNRKEWVAEHRLQIISWVFKIGIGLIVASAGYGIYLLVT